MAFIILSLNVVHVQAIVQYGDTPNKGVQTTANKLRSYVTPLVEIWINR